MEQIKKRRPKTFESYVRRLTICSDNLIMMCERNFKYETSKVATRTLLEKIHYGHHFEFDNKEIQFLGFFDNFTCLLKCGDTYYEGLMSFVQNGFGLKYRDLITLEEINYKKSTMTLDKKNIRHLVGSNVWERDNEESLNAFDDMLNNDDDDYND